MKNNLLLIAVLVVACSLASATNWTFGFESTGHGLYCDYEQINNNEFSPVVYGGVDNLSACGLSVNAAIAGFAGKLRAATNPQGFPVKGVILGDSIYATTYGSGINLQWTVATNLKCSEKKFGWVGIADYVSGTGGGSGFIFGDNYGYLSCNVPGKSRQHNGRMSTGKKAR